MRREVRQCPVLSAIVRCCLLIVRYCPLLSFDCPLMSLNRPLMGLLGTTARLRDLLLNLQYGVRATDLGAGNALTRSWKSTDSTGSLESGSLLCPGYRLWSWQRTHRS